LAFVIIPWLLAQAYFNRLAIFCRQCDHLGVRMRQGSIAYLRDLCMDSGYRLNYYSVIRSYGRGFICLGRAGS